MIKKLRNLVKLCEFYKIFLKNKLKSFHKRNIFIHLQQIATKIST